MYVTIRFKRFNIYTVAHMTYIYYHNILVHQNIA